MSGNVGFLAQTPIDATAVVATINGDAIDLGNHKYWGCQVKWTSTTASATVKFQESNDGIGWCTMGTNNVTILNDSGDETQIGAIFHMRYIRVVCIYTSGSVTTLACHFTAKP